MTLFNSSKNRKPAASEYNHIPFVNIPSSLNPLPELGLQNPVQEPSVSPYLGKSFDSKEITPPPSSAQQYQAGFEINENASFKDESTLPDSNTLSASQSHQFNSRSTRS
ncbi:MAG: hypothetical protein V4525_03635 [Pseudomonadota bacterium]